MTLSCQSRFAKRTFGKGIYVNEVTIADVQDLSWQELPFLNGTVDIGIRLFLDIGRDFTPDMLIAGNFKRDEGTGEVIGWGSGFLVQEALSKLGYTGQLEEDNRIPADALESIVGKKFLRLSYVSGQKADGKLKYSDWNQIATLEEGAESLAARFKRSLQKGYPKNYSPQLLDEPVVIDKTEEQEF